MRSDPAASASAPRVRLFGGPRVNGLTPSELAARTGYDARYLKDWLLAQAAGGYCLRDADGRFWLAPARAAVLADPSAGTCLASATTVAGVLFRDDHLALDAFRTNLIASWIPALDGVAERLERGIGVADRVRFEVAGATGYPGTRYGLVCVFDALHDKGGPHELGNQVQDATWQRLLAEAGFSRFRRATETPFNRIFEVRP
ncbi:MAG TPA: hypothetical protein VGC06_10850 [Actinomycetes bacterium]